MPVLLSRRDEARALRLARSQPESAGEFAAFIERLKEQVVEVALGDGRVLERVGGGRYRVLTADYREDKARDGEEVARLAEVGIYDYDRDVLVVAVVDLRSGEVTGLLERDGAAPPITLEELDEAREVAAGVPGASAALRHPRARVVAFPTPSYAFEARPGAQRHRGCVLYGTGPVGEALSVVIDLSARQVVPDDELPEILRTHSEAGADRPEEQ